MAGNTVAGSRFSKLSIQPPIEVFNLMKAYQDDPYEKKVNLSAGAYRTDQGEPWVLPCVRKVEAAMAADTSLNHEYLPILGLEAFSQQATALVLGGDNPAIVNGLAFGVQTLSGTGALRVAAEFLCRQLGFNVFYYSDPTWGNHGLVFKSAGFTTERKYRYWDSEKRGIDFDGMIADLKDAPPNSVIILHACAHNPTGCDPTLDQWKQIAQVIKEKELFPLFDIAYQGFASGDADKDALVVRYFTSLGFELIICQSFAKNFGLYNERIGNLTFVVNAQEVIAPIKSQLSIIIRAMYSNPPNHGARIVATVLSNPEYNQEWRECLKVMSGRIREMRELLRGKLESLGTPGTWDHITTQIGMFSYTGLNSKQVETLVKKYHIYLLRSGRISMCGLNRNNIDYVANAIYDVVVGDSGAKL
uniref:Aspartate aminotransferase n=1 Tax=Riptortus pedestris TaxID=329032 RepID=R4WDU0_RIPPE|nr:aspartate aminotransferase [Riptortus pedestris]